MATIAKHAPGSFCWVELGTTDQNAAKNFYANLLGWTIADMPMGPGEVYTIFKLKGQDAGAAYTLRKEQQGAPPHWMLYIASDDVDASVERASKLGAKIFAQPFDVSDIGRMAVLADPTGAMFSIWQAKKQSGIGIEGEDGGFCWADLSTGDVERARDFYSKLFGWQLVVGEKDSSGYLHIKNGEQFIGGIPPAAHRDPNAPPHWLIYFLTSNCGGTVSRAKQNGAKVFYGPMSMENVGRFAVLADPQGAAFAVFQSERK